MSQFDTYNNPAGRLFRLLVRGRNVANQSRSTLEVWAELLGIERENYTELLRRLAAVTTLPDAIERQVRALREEDPEILLDWLPRVRTQLASKNLDAAWENVIRPITEGDFRVLRICSDRLARAFGERDFSDDQLKSLHDALKESLSAAASDETLEPEVREFVISQLARVLRAVEEYRVSGIEAFRQTVLDVVAASGLQRETARKATRSAAGKTLLAIVGGLALATGITVDLFEIEDAVKERLTDQAAIERVVPERTTPSEVTEQPHLPDRRRT